MLLTPLCLFGNLSSNQSCRSAITVAAIRRLGFDIRRDRGSQRELRTAVEKSFVVAPKGASRAGLPSDQMIQVESVSSVEK